MHHTKDKGDLGVLKGCSRLSELGYSILMPISEHLPFDIVAYKDRKFLRVQVKYRHKNKGTVDVTLRTSWADKNGNHSRYYNLDDMDVFGIYCPDNDECYFVPTHILKGLKNSLKLRIEEAKNHAEKNIHHAEEFLTI